LQDRNEALASLGGNVLIKCAPLSNIKLKNSLRILMVFKFFMVSICDYTVAFRGLFSCISLKIGRDIHISCLSVACLKFHSDSDMRRFMFTDIVYGVSDSTGSGDLVCVICYVDSLLIDLGMTLLGH
jgi:hypothetical protein